MNSPEQWLSHLLHTDLINFYPKGELELLEEKINLHRAYCQHNICANLRK